MILEKVYRKQVIPMLEKGPMSIAVKIPLLNSAIYSVIRKKLLDAFGGNVGHIHRRRRPDESGDRVLSAEYQIPDHHRIRHDRVRAADQLHARQRIQGGIVRPQPARQLEVRIDSPDPQHEAGEIIVHGEHVMKGYYKNEKDTEKVLDPDGWLHTGDMATMDPDGTLYIRGRSKTMILTGNGQNIYPEEIEDKLNNMYLVLESLVLEAENGKIKALVVPDYEQAEAGGRGQGRPAADHAEQPSGAQRAAGGVRAHLGARTYPNEFEKTPKRSIKRYLYEPSLLNK